MPKLLMLVGVVGSGKTTFSTALCKSFPSWHRISQDDLGSRSACEDATRAALSQGKSVVIDRCNFNKKQREPWLRLARQFHADAYCLELKTDSAVCRSRIMARQGHPTNVQGESGTTILETQEKCFKSLDQSELAALKKKYTLAIHDNSVQWTKDVLAGALRLLEIDPAAC